MFTGNKLLGAIQPIDQLLLIESAVKIMFEHDQQLLHQQEDTKYYYFPTENAVASYFVALDGGKLVEAVVVGNEGSVGWLLSPGQLASFVKCAVTQRGTFIRISCGDLEAAKERSPAIAQLFSVYTGCLLTQILTSIACNAAHAAEQRAARWLCAAVERNRQSRITMTHEQFAELLGCGRSYASRIVQQLKRGGLLSTRRGGLEVLDYEGLRSRACGCDTLVKNQLTAALPALSANERV